MVQVYPSFDPKTWLIKFRPAPKEILEIFFKKTGGARVWTCGPVATARVALENPARAVVSTRQRNAAEPRAAPLGFALKVCRVTFKMTAWKRKDRGLHMVCLIRCLVFLVWLVGVRCTTVSGNNTTASTT